MDELPDESHQKIQAKLDADVEAFLKSCTKNWHDKVTQFCDPTYGDIITASTSSGAEENGDRKTKYDEVINIDSYPTHANNDDKCYYLACL